MAFTDKNFIKIRSTVFELWIFTNCFFRKLLFGLRRHKSYSSPLRRRLSTDIYEILLTHCLHLWQSATKISWKSAKWFGRNIKKIKFSLGSEDTRSVSRPLRPSFSTDFDEIFGGGRWSFRLSAGKFSAKSRYRHRLKRPTFVAWTRSKFWRLRKPGFSVQTNFLKYVLVQFGSIQSRSHRFHWTIAFRSVVRAFRAVFPRFGGASSVFWASSERTMPSYSRYL